MWGIQNILQEAVEEAIPKRKNKQPNNNNKKKNQRHKGNMFVWVILQIFMKEEKENASQKGKGILN